MVENRQYRLEVKHLPQATIIVNRASDFRRAIEASKRIHAYRADSFAKFSKMSLIDKQVFDEYNRGLLKNLRSDYKWVLELVDEEEPDFQAQFSEGLKVGNFHSLDVSIEHAYVRLTVGVKEMVKAKQSDRDRVINVSWVDIIFNLPELRTVSDEYIYDKMTASRPGHYTMDQIKSFMASTW